MTANASMDSTVDLSYSSDTMDTTGGTSSAASADAAVEDDAKAERTKLEDKFKTMIEEVKKKIPT